MARFYDHDPDMRTDLSPNIQTASGFFCFEASNQQTGLYILIHIRFGWTPTLISSALLGVETQAISLLRAEMLSTVIQQRLLQPLLP